ncbi:malto-oligosyltrehalose trehalohydrolase [Phytoactinopolyspora halotolerans]|uniref:Malto-oligosyltrehalose trehalohydrolase n=1 Tax=Phytoactinopolyspora halotolerans TaxID=1981512 RepID=A0A6L9S8Z7_9ACTN|nr:malto-oligosyltrehalose trehalohydrolase [Phytoactinopolyspora halotolerans]NEE01493.1 malto-oligosyltrehalose trehalohydrolase [Phytoactinopolyspora halotolerans]
MTDFHLWAPRAHCMRLRVGQNDDVPMTRGDDGWWSASAAAPDGADYGYLLDDSDDLLPDPRSRRQPYGIQGASRVYDQDRFSWTDHGWTGRDLAGAVIYELHIGTFSRGGTFDDAIALLDHLVELGITHVEVLPINAVNGVWNWGYDSVGWYAVHEPLGGPDAFKRFVDACHARGLAVVLDVVYNHVGPGAEFLSDFAPYLTSGRSTWGELINLAEPPVRRFIIDNALMWLRDYHVDGLRLDAVHALIDPRRPHLLAELSAEVEGLSDEVGRPLPLIAESDLNDPVMIEPRADGGYGMDAQWDDDVHHALHAMLTGERQGYYCDFGSLAVFAKVCRAAFMHDGTYSTFRGRVHGRPIDPERTAGFRFVVCLQNHDQVGNRAAGERLPELTSPGRVRIGAVLLLSLPFTPMLFMGEEWAASTRWPFFTSHPQPELAAATGPGRIEEFAEHGWDVAAMPDPQDPATFADAKLDWTELDDAGHAGMLELYRRLIALRAAEPELSDGDLTAVAVDYDEQRSWLVLHRGTLRVVVNLADQTQRVPLTGTSGVAQTLVATGDATAVDGGLELAREVAAIVRTT